MLGGIDFLEDGVFGQCYALYGAQNGDHGCHFQAQAWLNLRTDIARFGLCEGGLATWLNHLLFSTNLLHAA